MRTTYTLRKLFKWGFFIMVLLFSFQISNAHPSLNIDEPVEYSDWDFEFESWSSKAFIARVDHKLFVTKVLYSNQAKIAAYSIFTISVFCWLVLLYESCGMFWHYLKEEYN